MLKTLTSHLHFPLAGATSGAAIASAKKLHHTESGKSVSRFESAPVEAIRVA